MPKYRFELRDERRQAAPDILLELVGKTNLDANTIQNLVSGYVDTGKMELPNMMPEGQQGPLEQGQVRETPTNSLRKKEQGPAGAAYFYTTGPNGYQIVGTQPSRTDRFINVTPKTGGGRARTAQEAADLATVSKLQQALKEAGAKGVPVSAELMQLGVEAADRLGLPTTDEVVEQNVPGVRGMLQRLVPGGKTGKEMVRERRLGGPNRVRVSNGQEVLEIDEDDLEAARADGYDLFQ